MDYYIHDGKSFSLIFSKNFLKDKEFIQLHKKIDYYDQLYKGVFYHKLKETPIYVFSSPYNQVSNGITTSIPFLRVIFFPTGVERINDLAIINWADTVIAHEMAHVYQLGQISDYLIYLRAIFKNSQLVLIPFPVFLNVNTVMSLFFLEGHAVLSESLFAPGGRLYSGLSRALVFSQLKHQRYTIDQFIKERLINITNRNFSSSEKYNHGGYFFSMLMEKYSFRQINRFFKHHADHFIIPLSIIAVKQSFEKTFNTSFESLVNHYVRRYLPLAMQQKQSNGKALFHSSVYSPFNRQGNEVFFLTADLRSEPILRSFNSKTKKWTNNKKIFSMGKIFKMNQQYYVSTSHKISPWKQMYGLFSDGMYFLDKKYQSQSLQDIRHGKWLSIDTTNNIGKFRLLLNGKFYDETHSSALLGPRGGIYYFKQEGTWRVLYKDKRALFKFKGFYGKPVVIDKKGVVFFTAATRFGSSLFAWASNRGIYRVSDSDVIVDAIKVQGDRWLVCEIEPDNYVYKWITLKSKKSQPVLYQYDWQKKSNQNRQGVYSRSAYNVKNRNPAGVDRLLAFNNSKIQNYYSNRISAAVSKTSSTFHGQGVSASSETKDLQYSLYRPLNRIYFNGIDTGIFNDPVTKYNLLTGISFRDYLEYNALYLFYQVSRDNWVFRSQYTNSRYRLPWGIQYSYKQGLENFFGARAYSYIHELSNKFYIPFLRKGYWSSGLQLKGALSSLRLRDIQNQSYYFSVRPTWRVQYIRTYRNNFIYHRNFYLNVSAQYHAEIYLKDSNFLWNVYSYYTNHLGADFYVTPFISYRSAVKEKSIPFLYFKPLELIQKPELDVFFRKRELLQTNDYFFIGMRGQKVMNTAFYFSRFPFSIMRTAPLLQAKYIQYMDNDEDIEKYLFEWTIGMSIELLVHHKVPFRLNLYYGGSHNNLNINFLKEPVSFFGIQLKSHI